MANVKKGQTVPSPQWWKHLRDWKGVFWHRQRADDRKTTKKEAQEALPGGEDIEFAYLPSEADSEIH